MGDNTIMAVGLTVLSIVSGMLGLGVAFAAVPFLGLFSHDLVHSSLGTGSHVSERIRQVNHQHGVELEVYVFGPAERALDDPAHAEYRQTLVSLVKAGVPVHVCRDIAESMGKAQEFTALGLTLEYARDAFVRYARAGVGVVREKVPTCSASRLYSGAADHAGHHLRLPGG